MKKMSALRTLISRLCSGRSAQPSAPPQAKEAVNPLPPSYARDNTELWIMLCVGLISLTIYILTLAPGTVPGMAAVATGQALGLLPNVPANHPLFLLVTRGIAAVPTLDTVPRLNLFSALCGSLAAALLFRLTKRVYFEFIRDAPAIRLTPVGDEEPTAKLRNDPEADVMENIYASLGGVIATLAFAFSTPFWIASTSLHAQPFTLLLALLTADLLASYHYTGKTGVCVAAMLLLGLGMVESVVFVTLAPLALLLVLVASIRYGQISESFVLLVLASLLAGLAANLALFTLLSAPGEPLGAHRLSQLAAALANEHVRALAQGLPKNGWLLVLVQTTAPLLIALVSIRGFFALQDGTTRWKWGVANFFCTAFVIACLTNLPQTAWSLAREGSGLPIIPCLAIAIAAGALLVYWSLLASSATCNSRYDLESPSCHLQLLGFGICGLLVILSLRALNTNLPEADGRKTAFADRLADEMLMQAGPARCLTTDGTLDLNLLIRSHVTDKRVTLLPCPLEPDRARPEALNGTAPISLNLPGTMKAPKRTPTVFVADWLHNHPKEHDQVAVVGTPGIWQRAGLTPVPHGLVYRGTGDMRTLDGKALLESNRAFWRRVAPLLAADPALRPELRQTQTRVRQLASRMANDLGVLLERKGDLPGADAAYRQALQLEGDNLCAGLNRDGLRLRTGTPGASQAFLSHARALAASPGFFETFEAKVARDGLLSGQEADTLLPAILRECEVGSRPPAHLFRILDKWLAASHPTPPDNSRPIARAAPSADTTPDAMLSQALALWLDGQSAKAEKLLRVIVGNRPNNLSAWALLAEVSMARGQRKEVSEVILPAMRAVTAKTENADGTLVEMTQGCLALQNDPPHPAAARACFNRARSINPKLTSACDQLLRVDRLLGNAADLEQDALAILADNPNHADANAILGSLRLGQKRVAEAECLLRQSIKTQPTACARNDLAELLRQQDQLAEAEQQARLAIRLAPDFYPAWDTLVNILVAGGRPDEADGPLRCALALSANDPRLYLTLTRLHIKKGLLREASSVLDQSRPMFSQTSPSVRDEYAKLRQQLIAQSDRR